ncbi:gliding motility-associated C-terminal domain-containing protein [Flavobacterium kingsejongi]|uniref:Ig-like domain-containing protein n=1 Tax=Flavobacterium kingsejongi TaxID=1678728 RepID=A0A2S1LLC9_9FLAO|nr:gliding motility-associated C-terminal domain-containing protein [Flavobacterium kingsejongi]AWG24545.1 hypothetical protein FK004_04475 [Flavobacterium kingsejongi]
MKITLPSKTISWCFIALVFVCSTPLYSQFINAPTLGFTEACASPAFNQFNASFSYLGNFGTGNQFIVELSAPGGTFTQSTVVATLPQHTSPVPTSFSLPTNLIGGTYKIRIRSTTPAITSAASNLLFYANYMSYNQSFSINNSQPNINLCGGENYTLSIDANASAPINNPNLTYKWMRNFGEITGQTGSSIVVNQPGSYYALVNYGNCNPSSQAYSNAVTVAVSPSLTVTLTTDDNSNVICDGDDKVLVSSVQNPSYSYQWYHNDVLQPNATTDLFTATLPGNYYLKVVTGTCFYQSNTLLLTTAPITATLNLPAVSTIIPGEEKTIILTDNALQPTYQWYKDGQLLTGETSPSLITGQAGTYKVILTQNQGCLTQIERTVTLAYPLSFEAVVSAGTYQSCVSTSATLSLTELKAITANGTVDITQNNYGYALQWFQNTTAINGATTPALILNDATANGNYSLQISIPEFAPVVSNTIAIDLKITEANVLTASDPLCTEGNPVVLSSSVANVAYTYKWQKDGITIAGAVLQNYTATTSGTYTVSIQSGACTVLSNPIVLSTASITATIDGPSTDVLFPGQQKTLTTTTNALQPTYIWYRNEQVIPLQTNASIQISEPGVYRVAVTQNEDCVLTAESSVTIAYPSVFEVSIQLPPSYQECVTENVTLSMSQFTAETANGPVDLSANPYNYDFQWYKNGIAVTNATTASLILNGAETNGIYTLIVTIPDFDPVSTNAITVQLAIPNTVISTTDVLCEEGDSVLLQSNIVGTTYTYSWQKNGVTIATANQNNYTATTSGTYILTVMNGNCTTTSNTIQLQSGAISVSIQPLADLLILPNQTRILTAITSALQPTYSWYKESVLLPGENNSTLTVSQPGDYTVRVTQNQGCTLSGESQIITLVYPTGFEAEVTTAAYQECITENTSLSLSQFTALTQSGTIDLITNPYQYTFQWYKNGTPILNANATTLALVGNTASGNYQLEITIPDFSPVVSNTIALQLALENPVISTTDLLCEEGDAVLLQSNSTALGNVYSWQKNGILIPDADQNNYTATTSGTYTMIVMHGNCTATSNSITLQAGTITAAIQPLTDLVILPNQTRTLTAITSALQPTYSWYNAGVLLPGENASTLTVSQPGEYTVRVTQNQGCILNGESQIVTLVYPTGFEVGITTTAYQECSTENMTLSVDQFNALTQSGVIDLISNPYQYAFQWYKDDTPVLTANAATLALTGTADSGSYQLEITIPGFSPVLSNTLTIQLAITTIPVITTTGILCGTGDSIVLESSIQDLSFTYEWYKNGILITDADQPVYSTTTVGDYSVTIRKGNCSSTSLSYTVQTAIIDLAIQNVDNSIILPNQVITITTTTTAQQPTYEWYQNGILITGEQNSTIAATTPGTYKVIVTQTQGCILTKEAEITLVYPQGFDVAIGSNNYQECVNETATLHISQFIANTGTGTIDLLNNTYNYGYQWYKDTQPVTGATSVSLTINTAAENGNYYLEVTIPGFAAVQSNLFVLKLKLAEQAVISTTDTYCDPNSTVLLSSSVTHPWYSYAWFKTGNTTILGTQPTLTAPGLGSYYLEISYNGCTISSNTLDITPFDPSLVTIDAPEMISLVEGTTQTITASGATAYLWTSNGTVVSTTAQLTISQAGTYVLTASAGRCEVVKTITVTLLENHYTVIPNVVTPNADGSNDLWTLPEKYAYRPNVEIVIYDSKGKVVFQTVNYQNNWPTDALNLSKKTPVYYYTILENGTIIKKGSITIIK